MKALSLKQPFAELIVTGKKAIEIRTWNTSYRGDFLIHASLKPDKDRMNAFGLENLVTGCVVGKATLVDVKFYKTQEDYLKDKALHLAPEYWDERGVYGFVLSNPQKFETPTPAKGKLGFFDIEW